MDNIELRLEVLRIVVENGSERQKKVIPCQYAMNIINGFVRRMKIRLTKER